MSMKKDFHTTCLDFELGNEKSVPKPVLFCSLVFPRPAF
jgi:hypothetical protein